PLNTQSHVLEMRKCICAHASRSLTVLAFRSITSTACYCSGVHYGVGAGVFLTVDDDDVSVSIFQMALVMCGQFINNVRRYLSRASSGPLHFIVYETEVN